MTTERSGVIDFHNILYWHFGMFVPLPDFQYPEFSVITVFLMSLSDKKNVVMIYIHYILIHITSVVLLNDRNFVFLFNKYASNFTNSITDFVMTGYR